MKNEPQELRELLSRLPDAPVSSNFTARVMQAVELEERQAARVAVASVALVMAGLVVQQHEVNAHRTQLAEAVARVTAAQPLPSVDALQNFDAIQRMSQPAHADEGLLALASDLK